MDLRRAGWSTVVTGVLSGIIALATLMMDRA
jgi:hypothetical protein